MKIVLISNLYPPYVRGGAEVIAEKVVYGLQTQGHKVFVISSCPFSGLSSLFGKWEQNVYRFFPLNIFYYLNDYKKPFWWRYIWHFLDVFNLHSYFMVKNILIKTKPDLVLSHNLKGLGYLIPLAIKHCKIKHIHTLHDVQLANPSGLIIWTQENKGLNNKISVKIYQKINKKLFSVIDKIISPSKFLLKYYQTKGFFTENDCQILSNPIKIENSIKPQSGKWSEMNFLYLGQIEQHKGVEFLLNVFINFCSSMEDYLDYKLHVVGDGTQLKRLKTMYEHFPQIKFYGHVKNSKLGEIFSQMDYLVFPSLCYENSPAVISESLANSVPVIVSDIGGAAELVKEKENGFIFSPGNIHELLEIFNFIKQNVSLSQDMKTKCLASIKKHTIKQYLKELLKEEKL